MTTTTPSGLILPNSMPNLQSEREQQQWMEGKASRTFVLNEVNKIYKEFEMIGDELKRASMGFSQLFQFQKMMGLQLETFVRMLNDAVPEFKTNFAKEYERTIVFGNFIDSLNNTGANGAKPMREKIDLAREWNGVTGNLPVSGMYFGLFEYMMENIKEFTEEDIHDLCATFDMSSKCTTLLAKKRESVEAGQENVVNFPTKVEGNTDENKS